MTQRYTDPETGRQYEEGPDGWVDVTPTPEQVAAQEMTPFAAALASAGNVVQSLARGYLDQRSAAPGLTFAPTAQRPLSDSQNQQIRAQLKLDQADANAEMAAMSQEHPVASVAGATVPYLAAMALPQARGGVGRMMATEGAVGGTLGFVGRPGSMSERVQAAALEGAMAAGGAGLLGGVTRATGTGYRMVRDTAEDIRGRISGRMRAELELEALDGRPRLGATADREYARLASSAEVPSHVNPVEADLVARADELMVPLTTGQRTQNLQMMQWESGLARIPTYSKPFTDLKRFGRERLNDAVAQALDVFDGARAGQFSSGQLGRALSRLSRGFEDVAQRLPEMDMTPQFAARLQRIEDTAREGIGNFNPVFKNIKQLRNRFVDAEGNPRAMTGEELIEARSQLNREMRRLASSSESNTNAVLKTEEMVDLVDDMIEAAAGRADDALLVGDYKKLRDQWRLADMIDRHRLVNEGGDVSAARFGNAAERRYVREYRRSDLTPDYVRETIADVLDISKILNGLANTIPDSGTPTGNFVQQFLDEPIKTLIRGGGDITVGRMAFEAQRTGGPRQLSRQVMEAIEQPSRPAMIFGAATGAAAAEELERRE